MDATATGESPRNGRSSRDHLEQDASERVQVRSPVDRLSLCLLGREVRRGSEDGGRLRDRVGRGRDASDPEVRHLHAPVLVEHDVARLDVPVDHALRVGGLERVAHVDPDLDRAVGHDPPAAGDQVGERSPLDVLHDDEVHAVVGPGVEDRDEVLIADPRRRLCLAPEAVDEVLVVGELRREDLDRDRPAEHRVLAPVDLGHAAAAELLLDAVAAYEHHRLVDVFGPSCRFRPVARLCIPCSDAQRGLDDRSRDRGRDLATRCLAPKATPVEHHDRDGDLGGSGRGERHEPRVRVRALAVLGSTRLARDRDTGDLRGGSGARPRRPRPSSA